jgi:proliferating cell nuclear antigen
MFEARFKEAALFKKILEALKDLVTEANFECSNSGISLQAMDSSHVSLVSLLLLSDGFDQFRCDRNLSLGINLASMSKIFKCASTDDMVTIKAEDDGDVVTFVFESPNQVKISDFELKLIHIDSEQLGIPDTEYGAVVKLSSNEFQHIIRDLGVLGDTVVICVTKDGVKFSVRGDLGNGNITCRPSSGVDDEKKETPTAIQLRDPVQLSFAQSYLNSFTKASSLSNAVTLSLSKEVPLLVEFRIAAMGYIRFYLAPKIEDQ